MSARKNWTVLVYLAADNNLRDFGISSLRQMKTISNENINVLAEFDTGPASESKRFCFKGGDPYTSINSDLVQTFRPANAADPDNLVDFIRWGAENYPAHHYFVIVWGHGAGVDDAFPRANDNTFVPRHSLLSLTKGILDVPMKGILEVPMKGILEVPMKGILEVPMKGALEAPLKDAIGNALSSALQQGIAKALDEQVLGAVNHGVEVLRGANLTDAQSRNLKHLRTRLQPALHEVVVNRLQRGTLWSFQQSITDVVTGTIIDALGSIFNLQKKVLAGLGSLDKARLDEMVADICGVVERDLLGFLERRVSAAMQATAALADTAQKSLAFVDHPSGYMNNLDLRNALARASELIGKKIDIFGMDACNMNMVEIGYELRDSVRYMVASQDHIPDASWPYDYIVSRLSESPKMKPLEVACLAAEACITGYQDCLDTSVTMSVLDLQPAGKIAGAAKKLADHLLAAMNNPDLRSWIDAARRQTRSFGLNEFADLGDFCACLESVLQRAEVEPQTQAAARAVLAPIAELIVFNRVSSGEQGCNGTSICFPQFDPQRAEHLTDMVREYAKLEFARDTGWDKLIGKILRYQEDEVNAGLALITASSANVPDHAPRPAAQSAGSQPAAETEHRIQGHPTNGHSTNGHANHDHKEGPI